MQFFKEHSALLGLLALFSFLLLVASLLLIPWIITRLPSDYFHNPHHRPLESLLTRPVLRMSLLIIKNAIGVILAIAGIAMLVLPGQGLLTLLVAMILIDFPGKFALKRKLISITAIHKAVNAIRQKRGQAPFEE